MITFLFPSIFIIIIGLMFFSLIILKNKINKLYFFYGIVFSIYTASVISLTMFPFPYQKKLINDVIRENYGETNNLIPFKTILYAFSTPINREGIIHLIGNIFLFIPLGFMLLIFFDKVKVGKVIFIGFLCSLTIETVQFLLGLYIGYNYRSSDIDDVILNTLGSIVGILVFKIFKKSLIKNELLKVIKSLKYD